MGRTYDIVVFGATGFTGQRVCKYLFKSPASFTWAMAGRSAPKMRELLEEMRREQGGPEKEVPILEASVDNVKSIDEMTSSASVIINCVGPFVRMGEVVVASCVRNSTHYVDITGEPLFIEKMIFKYGETAKSKGCTIVPACGFDSIPADLGTVFTTSQFPKGLCSSVEAFLYVKPGAKGLVGNYGTYESLVDGFSNAGELRKLRQSMGRAKLPTLGPTLPRNEKPHFSKRFGKYVLPFPGADASVVRASQHTLTSSGAQSTAVQFAAYFMFSSIFSILLLAVFQFVLSFLVRFGWGKKILINYGELLTFGAVSRKGPSEEQIRDTTFSTTFIGRGYSKTPESPKAKPDTTIVTRVAGPEVGYVTTPICVCESAFVLLEKARGNSSPVPHGVMTPAAAFADSDLISRLNIQGVTFSVVERKGPQA